ncbi:MAG: ribonuclease HII [Candidatus Woesearchaeota archaeon]
MTIYIAGSEEAGRGPIIGPMVMVVGAVEKDKESLLKEFGVKDSKLLSPEQREKIFLKLKKIMVYELKILLPKDIDAAVSSIGGMNLNWLEARTTVELINKLSERVEIEKVIVDCPSNNINVYNDMISHNINNKNIKIVSEHKADVKYPIVSACSIIAKVIRDHEIEKIKKKYNVDFGSGYPSDPKTIEFVEKNWDKYNFFRKSWETYKKYPKMKVQKGLSEFQ